MAEKIPEYPEVGDLVIATIDSVTTYGAYAKLDEYNKQGLLHVSEISSSWIRNIRDYVREGQKTVLKVLRVDPDKGHIDLSLRRVTKRARIEKTRSFKQDRKAEALLREIQEKLSISTEELYSKAVALMEENFSLYEVLEQTAKEGSDFLVKLGVPENISKVFAEVTADRIPVKQVRVKGTLEVLCPKPNGVKIIKNSFLNAKKAERTRGAEIRFYVIAAPNYSVEVSAENYKQAEEVLQKVTQNVISNVVAAGGQSSFRREK